MCCQIRIKGKMDHNRKHFPVNRLLQFSHVKDRPNCLSHCKHCAGNHCSNNTVLLVTATTAQSSAQHPNIESKDKTMQGA